MENHQNDTDQLQSKLKSVFDDNYQEYLTSFNRLDKTIESINDEEIKKIYKDEANPFYIAKEYLVDIDQLSDYFSKTIDINLVKSSISGIKSIIENTNNYFDTINKDSLNEYVLAKSLIPGSNKPTSLNSIEFKAIIIGCAIYIPKIQMLLNLLHRAKEKETYQIELGKITDALKKAAGKRADLKMEDHFNNLADPTIDFKIFKISILSKLSKLSKMLKIVISFKSVNVFKVSTTFLWLIAIISLSISLFCISLYFDKIYLGDHLSIAKNFYNNSLECLDTFKEKIICIEKKSVLTFPKNMEVYSYISSRISMIISVLIPLIFCIKNYNINKRNQIAYKHIATVFHVSDAAQKKFSSENEFSKAELLFLEKYAAFLFQSPENSSSHDDEDKESYKQVLEAGQLIAKAKGKD